MSLQLQQHAPPVRQFSVMLQNRVGALAALVKLLRSSAIEVLGLSVQDSCDATIARLVVSDPDTTAQIFIEKGIPYTECELLVVEFKEAGPDLMRCLDLLMEAETNLDFAYPLLPYRRESSLLALHVEDLEFAASLLHNSGFIIVWQDGLSR